MGKRGDAPTGTEVSLEKELALLKVSSKNLQQKTQVFYVSFLQMKPRERAQNLQDIQREVQRIEQFLTRAKASGVTNYGIRYSIDTFQQSFQIYLGRWKRFERSLDQAS